MARHGRPPFPVLTASALLAATALVLTALPAAAAATPSPFIVVLKPVTGRSAAPPARRGVVTQVYTAAFNGYAAMLTTAELAAVRADPATASVVPDQLVSIEPPVKGAALAPAAQAMPTGIDRIDAEQWPGGRPPLPRVRVAVLDTGIDAGHPDLAGLVVGGRDCIGGGTRDVHGHGTHVSGTIAAHFNAQGVFGVLPDTQLLAVRVLGDDGWGRWSQIICGIDWVTANAATLNIKVANMSLGGDGRDDGNCGNSNGDALHRAICRSVAAGVTYVVAAGNHARAFGGHVPAAYNEVVTVSALADSDGRRGGLGPPTSRGADDTFATFSNWADNSTEAAHTVAAPGVSILSTMRGGGYASWSGTSMATPHVTGIVAKRQSLLIAYGQPVQSPAQILAYLRTTAEPLGLGHTDPSGRHPEPVVNATGLPPR